MSSIKILNMDVIDGLRSLPEKSVHCVITSPPYWGLRQYLFNGAVVVKPDLTDEQKTYLVSELNKMGVKPKYGGNNEGI